MSRLTKLTGWVVLVLGMAPALADAELATDAKANMAKIYFDRCAGCHGTLRQGAIGKNLEPEAAIKLGQERLEKVLAFGTEGGMPNFNDILSKEEIAGMAAYLQTTPDQPPEFGLKEMKESWKVLTPVAKRPTKQLNGLNLKNLFSVTLRDKGEVALIDGDKKEIWGVVKTGYAVHISRFSASGRYLYVIGRDGRLDMVDLWLDKPAIVATLKAGIDARSVEISKFKGYEDKYVVVGSYWPSQYAVLDGQTLEPLKVVSTRGDAPDGKNQIEPRVASIAASHLKPAWVINVKETGLVKLVDYADLNTLKETVIPAVKSLHNGGWDPSRRYFLVAANMINKVAVIDTQEGKLTALIDTKAKPHPGRGANFVHPKFGPVWATSHLGAEVITLIGVDPDKHKEFAWKVVQELPMHGTNSLFVKTHPNSTNLWADAPLHPDREVAQAVSVYDIKNLGKEPETIDIGAMAGLPETKGIKRVVQPEYNAAGDEVWFSVWVGNKNEPSAIVVIDDKTRKMKAVIKDPRIVTPTGKFNALNTTGDVY